MYTEQHTASCVRIGTAGKILGQKQYAMRQGVCYERELGRMKSRQSVGQSLLVGLYGAGQNPYMGRGWGGNRARCNVWQAWGGVISYADEEIKIRQSPPQERHWAG